MYDYGQQDSFQLDEASEDRIRALLLGAIERMGNVDTHTTSEWCRTCGLNGHDTYGCPYSNLGEQCYLNDTYQPEWRSQEDSLWSDSNIHNTVHSSSNNGVGSLEETFKQLNEIDLKIQQLLEDRSTSVIQEAHSEQAFTLDRTQDILTTSGTHEVSSEESLDELVDKMIEEDLSTPQWYHVFSLEGVSTPCDLPKIDKHMKDISLVVPSDPISSFLRKPLVYETEEVSQPKWVPSPSLEDVSCPSLFTIEVAPYEQNSTTFIELEQRTFTQHTCVKEASVQLQVIQEGIVLPIPPKPPDGFRDYDNNSWKTCCTIMWLSMLKKMIVVLEGSWATIRKRKFQWDFKVD